MQTESSTSSSLVARILTGNLLIVLLFTPLAHASTITVTNAADSGAGTLRDAIVSANSGDTISFGASLSGQTITLTSGQITISNSLTIDASGLPAGLSVSGNSASRVFNLVSGSAVVLNSLAIINGAAGGLSAEGGGIYCAGTSLILDQCHLTGNSSDGDGGGLYVASGMVTLNACTVSSNSAGANSLGGGIANTAGILALNQCTVAGNTAPSLGGGIFLGDGGGTVTLNQSTVSGNSANNGGGIYQLGGALEISNSIVAGNSFNHDIANVGGTFTYSGVNLTNGSPQLGPLGNHGGPTPTMLPLPVSPALDACTTGTSFTADQRGFPRVVGAYADLGAVEMHATTVTTLTANPVGAITANLMGNARPGDYDTATWFEWGVTPAYGNYTETNWLAASNATLVVSKQLGGLSGASTYHYRVAASNALGLFFGANVSFTTRHFEEVLIAGLPGVYRSSVAWGDYDNDGRLDFLLTGLTTNQSISQVWRNTGSGFTNLTDTVAPGLPGVHYSSVAWGDYDNDGWLDFLLTGISSNSVGVSQVWRNTGSGFTNLTDAVAPGLPGVYQSAVAWGDYDNDGRLDFLLTGLTSNSVAASQIWRNTGSGFTNVTAVVAPGLPGLRDGSVAWGDYDNDGRLDFLLTGYSNNIAMPISQIWRKTSSGFTNVTALVAPDLPGVYESAVAWADYDNDGWLDFLISGASNAIPVYGQVWRNMGNGFTKMTVPDFRFGAYRGSAAWGDYDNDGRLDILFTTKAGGATGISYGAVWRNTGSSFEIGIGFGQVADGAAEWGDFDNDGDLDILLTGRNSGDFGGGPPFSKLWQNQSPITNTPPSAPTGLAMTATPDAVMLSWNSAADDFTPAPGLTYNVRAGSAPGGIDLYTGHVNATNGFRRVPAMGNTYLRHSLPLTGLTNGQTVYWSVQAVDTSFAAGPFATETSSVTTPQLTITPSDTTNAIVSWTPPTFGWHLEETPALVPAAWSNSPSGELNPIAVSSTNSVMLYRLKRQ